jgi:hypothetical protein
MNLIKNYGPIPIGFIYYTFLRRLRRIRQRGWFIRLRVLQRKIRYRIYATFYFIRHGRAPFSRPIFEFPLFEISSNPTIPFAEVLERRFDLIERARDVADQDNAIFDSIGVGIGIGTTPVHMMNITATGNIGIGTSTLPHVSNPFIEKIKIEHKWISKMDYIFKNSKSSEKEDIML